MVQILNVIAPIYLLIGLGFLMTKLGPFKTDEIRIIGKFVLNVALPALIIRSLVLNSIIDIFNPTYLIAYTFGTFASIGIGYFWFKSIADQDSLSATFNVIGISCSNSGFIGYPIVLLVLPNIAGNALALNMLVENLVIIPFLLFMAERSKNQSTDWSTFYQTLDRLKYNPIIIAIAIGVLISLTGFKPHYIVIKTIDLFAVASSAASLFVIGGSLVGVSLSKQGKQILPVLCGKLILHPLFVFGALLIASEIELPTLEPDYKIAAIIMAATPMMGVYPTLAQAYGRAGSSALNMLAATIFSMVTLSILLFFIQNVVGF
jgi:malonate transporter and related proteins